MNSFDTKVMLHTLAAFGPMTSREMVRLLGLNGPSQVTHAIHHAGPAWVQGIGTAPRPLGKPGRAEVIYGLVKEDARLKITDKVHDYLQSCGMKSCAQIAEFFGVSPQAVRVHLKALRQVKRVRIAEHRIDKCKWTAYFDVSDGEPDAAVPVLYDDGEDLFRHDPSLEQHVLRRDGLLADHVNYARSRVERAAEIGSSVVWAGLMR